MKEKEIKEYKTIDNQIYYEENYSKEELENSWKTGIGLQDVDNLKVSKYLIDIAKDNIEGKINDEEIEPLLKSYYDAKEIRNEVDIDEKNADIVSSRITKLLKDNSFKFSPIEYLKIHEFLFKDLIDNAGEIRTKNIRKVEWVLEGDSVNYGNVLSLKDNLYYDFNEEKNFIYKGIKKEEFIKHIAYFASQIWQNHVFIEGNTRTTAVFLIKYLRTFGFKIDNDVFANNSWYFRNALVRANYKNFEKNIDEDISYLEKFFENLLFNGTNKLENKKLHINYKIENNNDNELEL